MSKCLLRLFATSNPLSVAVSDCIFGLMVSVSICVAAVVAKPSPFPLLFIGFPATLMKANYDQWSYIWGSSLFTFVIKLTNKSLGINRFIKLLSGYIYGNHPVKMKESFSSG